VGKVPLLYWGQKFTNWKSPYALWLYSWLPKLSTVETSHILSSPLVGSTLSHMKNFTQFAELYPDEILLSIDFVSLYTNFPDDLAGTLEGHTNLSPDQILSLTSAQFSIPRKPIPCEQYHTHIYSYECGTPFICVCFLPVDLC